MPIAVLAAALLLAAPPTGMGQDALPRPSLPMSTGETLALFKRLCVDTHFDPTRFAAAIAAEHDAYRQAALPFGPPGMPSVQYRSDRAEVNYTAFDDAPAGLPTRLCAVRARSATGADHRALATAMTAALSLPVATPQVIAPTSGRERMGTEWRIPAVNGGTLRYSLLTRAAPGAGSYNVISLQAERKPD